MSAFRVQTPSDDSGASSHDTWSRRALPAAEGAWSETKVGNYDNSPALRMPEVGRGSLCERRDPESALELLGTLWDIAAKVQWDPLQRMNPEVLETVRGSASAFRNRLQEYSTYQAVLGVTSLANIGYRDLDVFRQLHTMLRERTEILPTAAIADVVWSCGTLRIHEPALLNTLKKAGLQKERAARKSERVDPRSAITFKERALLAWGFAAACPESDRDGCVRQFAHPQDLGRAGVYLNHWHLMYQGLVISGMVDAKDQFANLQRIEERVEERHLNNFEASVLSSTMDLLGEDRCSYHIHKSICGVEADLLIESKYGNVIIEADGEAYHRLIGPDGGMLRGKDKAQDAFFEKLGVKAVIHVGSWEWDPVWGEDIIREKIKVAAPFLLNRP